MDDVFDLREFMITILRKWRMIVILMLVCAAVGAGYKLIPSFLPAAESPEAQGDFSDLQDQYEKGLELLTVGIAAAERDLENCQTYLETSLLLKMDEDAGYQGTAAYYIAPDESLKEGDGERSLLQAAQMKEVYVYLLNSSELYQGLADGYGENVTATQMRELVSIVKLDGNLFQVVAAGENSAQSSQLLSQVERYLNQKSAMVTTVVGSHRLQKISETVEQKPNANIATARINTLTKIDGLETSLAEQNKKLQEMKPPVAPNKVSKQTVLKFGLLGAAGGAGLALLLVFFIDVMDVRIKTEQEVCKKYKLKCLADFSNIKREKHHV